MDSIYQRFRSLQNASRIGYLIGGFITNTLSIEEHEELDGWVLEREENMQFFEDVTDDAHVDEFMRLIANLDTESALLQVKKRIKTKERKAIRFWQYAAAACLLGLIGWGIYTITGSEPVKGGQYVAVTTDIQPGSSTAQLRLPGGKIVSLDAVVDTAFDNINIKEGLVVFRDTGNVAMHELAIPRKGFYRLHLPDGSKVWLNSESSIKFPGVFTGDRREVTVTGETYFEIAKDPSRPFIVAAGDRRIQAVGTAFNINTFNQRVTLTEGIIDVAAQNRIMRLMSGEQMEADGRVVKADIQETTAWTVNKFKFKNATLEEIMPQLERWYDCRIEYKERIGYHFNATISRSVPVSRVLQLLEGTHEVRFTINENRIIVQK